MLEEFKCGKTSLEMTLSQSKDPAVKDTAPLKAESREEVESMRSGSTCTRCITEQGYHWAIIEISLGYHRDIIGLS